MNTPEPVPSTQPEAGSGPWISAAAFARRVGKHRSTITRLITTAAADPNQQLDHDEDPATGRRTYPPDQLQALWNTARHHPGPAPHRGTGKEL